jgi:hypothetical protein|tara:strand:- start:1378 stop:1716 length:339 start_codon:yes stop_codon:yes gene_type:complete
VKENKLIAEFMGLPTEVFFKSGIMNYHHDGAWYEEHELSYEISWDWLMPVVEKIEEYGYDFIATKRRATLTYDANFMDEVNNYVVYVEDCKDRQEATYKAVVEFIKQHNKES